MRRIGALIIAAAIVVLIGGDALGREVFRADGPKTLIPMDSGQENHLRAYGVAYWALQAPRRHQVHWLLNYRGGAFMLDRNEAVERRAALMGVTYEPVDAERANMIYDEIEVTNSEVIALEKAPRVAVYKPPTTDPWDDAVNLALDYAEIPFDRVWDDEVLAGVLVDYDWLHLHHEDFTGQYGKFYAFYRHADWYRRQVSVYEQAARRAGFDKVSRHKLVVALRIVEYVENGGFLFAMCSAPETLDVALAAEGVDIVASELDGDPVDPDAQERLDYSKTFAFKDFEIIPDPMIYAVSDIDVPPTAVDESKPRERFCLFEFSAKQDPALSMLVQNHVNCVDDFLGQTTAFRRNRIKDEVIILGDFPGRDKVKYIHGARSKGIFTFYSGHDPEDYAHYVGDPPTNLEWHPNSPGYRLILNNLLFPAARKRKRKTLDWDRAGLALVSDMDFELDRLRGRTAPD